jgi:hemoglobin
MSFAAFVGLKFALTRPARPAVPVRVVVSSESSGPRARRHAGPRSPSRVFHARSPSTTSKRCALDDDQRAVDRVEGEAAATTDAGSADATTTSTTTAGEEETKSSLFERVGGEDALNAAVELFYQKNLADDRISEMFEGTDMKELKAHQSNFLRMAFGGDSSAYRGRGVYEAHKELMLTKGLDESHFDCVAENLVAALRELDVANDAIDDVVAIVSPLRDVFDHEKNETYARDAAEREH